MVVTVKLLEHPTEAQIDEALNVCLRAFEGDVIIPPMTGFDSTKTANLYRGMLAAGALEGSFYVVSDDADKKIRTVGVWFGPGNAIYASEVQRAAGLDAHLASLPEETREWWTETLYDKYGKMLSSSLGSRYVDGWFADVIATDPEHQRNGYATALIQHVCERASREGKTIALSTQRIENTRFYEKRGFKIVGKEFIPAARDSGWTVYVMLWEP